MAQYYIGTAGWSYEDWVGIVYPISRQAGFHPLTYLAAFINIVEVNSTFYRPPSLAMSLSWVKKLPPGSDFLFSVKLHQSFTHERKGLSAKDADVFKHGLEPLVAARRLAALLVQFPWSFAHTPANDDYLAGLFELFSGYPLALEVRHASWDRPEFYATAPRTPRRILQHRPAGHRRLAQADRGRHASEVRVRPPARPQL